MQIGRNSLLPALAAGYLIASFAAPPAVAALQQWLSISHNAVFENTVGGELILPGGSLDPTDLLDGIDKTAKILFTAQVLVQLTQDTGMTETAPIMIDHLVEITATVPGKKRPKRVARMQAQLVDGAATMNASVTAKKMIGKGIVTFDIVATGDAIEPYTADVTYKMERPSDSGSR